MSIWSWLASTQNGGVPTEALTAIASVAVVIWTGGFIVRGWMRTTASLVAGMSYLQFAFFGSVLGLLSNGLTLRAAAVAFFAYYVVFFRKNADRLREIDEGALPIIPLLHVTLTQRRRFWIGVQIVELVPLAVVFVWPEPRVIAWLCAAMTFIGYQIMLTFVYSDFMMERGLTRKS
jgi:hypothetical protein